MPRADLSPLTTVGVVIVIIAAGVVGLYVYLNYTTFFGTGGTANTVYFLNSPINQPDTPLSAQALLINYEQSPSAANKMYTNRTAYLSGYVTTVQESQSGTYQTCVNQKELSIYDCTDIKSISGFVIWNWNSQSVALQVSADTNIVAECSIAGLSGGNLVLNYCILAG